MEFIQEIKVPNERIAVLIGKKGSTKRRLCKELNIKITIDTEEQLVTLKGEDNFKLLIGKEVVQAIARGFNPEIALSLLNEENVCEIIDITDFSGNSKQKLFRLRARVIGREGKARENIEQLTHTHISIFGKTVAIIGILNDVLKAKHAIETLLRGSKHATVYSWLEKQE